MFTEEFCQAFVDELENFEQSDMPKGRPNTMNNYGVGLISCALLCTFPALQLQSVSHFTRGSLSSGPPWSDRAEGMLQGQKKGGMQGKRRGLLS